MPSKRQREEERAAESPSSSKNETLLTLSIAPHHRTIASSWKTDDPALGADIQEFLSNPFELALSAETGATTVKSVAMTSGAWRNVPIALPGEGVVYATATVSLMTTSQ